MLRCIRFGEVLLDETFRTFLICNQCQTEFVEIPEFRVHLATSTCGKRLFKDDVFALKFGAAQVTRGSKDKTYLLYNPADVQIATAEPVLHNNTSTPTDAEDDAYLDLIKIEEELLDPRWYTDIRNAEVESPQHTTSVQTAGNSNKPMEYKELVEAVGPYVQFKDGASKGKQNMVVRRVPNKANKPVGAAPKAAPPPAPAAVPKNSIAPGQRESIPNSKPAARLVNPAAKRKLDLTPPKQVHFKNEVKVKYVMNEDAEDNKRTRSLDNENNEQTATGDGAMIKRRKTITIPMVHINIHPDFQERFGRGCGEAAKETANTGATSAVVKKLPNAEMNAARAAKANSLARAVSNTNVKAVPATTKVAHTQANHKQMVPNPLVQPKQADDTKNQIKSDAMLVKNPITYSRSNMNCVRNETAAQSSKPQHITTNTRTITTNTQAPTPLNKPSGPAPTPLNKPSGPAPINTPNAPVMARPAPQRVNSNKPTILQQTRIAPPTNKIIPPALAPLTSNRISNPAALAAAKNPSTDVQKQTNDILSKLQTRGLQVKRTQPPMPPQAAGAILAGQQQNKTMELLQKLQSKGMKVKILNGKEPTYAAGAAVTHVSINLPIATANTNPMNNMGNVRNRASDIGTQNKTILNNKLIIRKV